MPFRPRSRSSRAATPSVPVADPPRAPSRRPVYVCAAAEIMFTLGGSICSVPWTRLLESAVCRRHLDAGGGLQTPLVLVAGSLADLLRDILAGIGPGAEMDEALCKGDNVQAEMAGLMGLMASFAVMPSGFSPGPVGCFWIEMWLSQLRYALIDIKVSFSRFPIPY